MGEIRRRLEYKSAWRYTELVIAPRLFPSSKICSSCQHRDGRALADASGAGETVLNDRRTAPPDLRDRQF